MLRGAPPQKCSRFVLQTQAKLDSMFNPYWGSLFRSGTKHSYFSLQVERFAGAAASNSSQNSHSQRLVLQTCTAAASTCFATTPSPTSSSPLRSDEEGASSPSPVSSPAAALLAAMQQQQGVPDSEMEALRYARILLLSTYIYIIVFLNLLFSHNRLSIVSLASHT